MGKVESAGTKRTGRAGWLTRRQVAELAGLDESRIAKMDTRELHPVRRSDGSWTYEPSEVGAFLAGGTVSGTVTARAFAMFMEGKSDPEVVIETLQPARRIRELRAEYEEMTGALTLAPSSVDELKTALGVAAVKDGAALTAAVRSALDAKFRAGFLEGRADAEDYGEVTNPLTGERRRITRS